MENQAVTDKGKSCCGHAESHAEHSFKTATEALKADHRVIEQVLNALERLAQAPELSALDQWEKAIDFIRNFADKCHHLKEEKLLFPAMEEHGVPLEGGPLGVMLMEHEEGRGYVKAMAAALTIAAKDPAAAKKALQEMGHAYVRFLREHIQKEDDILFNMADGVLSAEEQKELLRDFEEHELKEIGAGVYEKYLAIAQELTAGR
jgi:hemerythrin-like domain-containing protein